MTVHATWLHVVFTESGTRTPWQKGTVIVLDVYLSLAFLAVCELVKVLRGILC